MPEFSVICCSVNDEKFARTRQYYDHALGGETWEMIRIDDAKSMCEGYNRGLNESTGNTIIMTHDDAAPLKPVAAKLRRHLREVDILGGAGANRLIDAKWFTAGPPYIFGQVLNQTMFQDTATKQTRPGFMLTVFGVPKPLVTGVKVLDGFWMAGTRAALQCVRFDEKAFDGFHLYDLDFSYRAYRQGFKLGVACDLNLLHASSGGYGDPKWQPAAERFMRKWKGKLDTQLPRGCQFTGVMLEGNMVPVALTVMDEFVEATR